MASSVVRKDKQEQLKLRIEEIRNTYKGMEIKAQIKKARADLGLDAVVSDELQYLDGANAKGYLYDMIFAQKYAEVNRAYIASTILKILGFNEMDRIETVHNFIDFRDFIIRKGSVRSYVGERFILPFNMRDGILICEGKSNPEWNYSAPHGAGRVMSRAQAKKNIKLENFAKQMDGIFSTSVCNSTLDEAPDAYKDAKVIEAAIEPTAKILARIKPIMNMKDGGGTNTD
jgi:RNA-splicing ligase RtcB